MHTPAQASQASARPGIARIALSGAVMVLLAGGCVSERGTTTAEILHAWPTAVPLADPELDLIAVPDIARIIHLSLHGQPNILHVHPDWLGMQQDPSMEKGGQYRDFGGAKLWNAPQSGWHRGTSPWPPDYLLDSAPAQSIRGADGALTLTGQASAASGIRFTRTVSLAHAAVTDRVTMANTDKAETASWGVWSVLCVRPDGVVFLPVPASATLWSSAPDHLIPDSYGWKRHADVLVLEHPSDRGTKIFSTSDQGWIGYLVDHQALFITYHADPAAAYPEHEASSEVYAQPEFIELEHIGRLEHLIPGASADFTDQWHIVPGPPEGLSMDQQAAWMATTAQSLR